MAAIDCTTALGFTGTLVLLVGCQFETAPLSGPGDLISPAESSMTGGDAPARVEPPRVNPPTGAASPPIGETSGARPPASAEPQGDRDAAADPPSPDAGGTAVDPAPNPSEDAAVDVVDAGPPEPSDDDHPPADNDAAIPPAATEPDPGTPFSRCRINTDCSGGMVCTTTIAAVFTGMQPDAGYCASYCNWSSTTGETCPQPAKGLVKASCQLGGMVCLLESCERSVCPDNMQCIDTETPLGAGQVVHSFNCNY